MKVSKLVEMAVKFKHSFRQKHEAVNFLSLTNNGDDCLICMPAKLEHMLFASEKLPELAAIFPNRVIRVMVTSNIDHRSHEYIKNFTLERPYSYDITTFNLPKNTFIEKLRGNGVSICIDLEFEHNFFNSCVCLKTLAPLRIGSNKGMGLPYYNLEIDIGNSENINTDTYDNFMKVLYNFKDKGETIAPIEA